MLQCRVSSAMSAPNINRSVLSTTRAPRKETGNTELMNNQLSLLALFKVEHAVDQARAQVRFTILFQCSHYVVIVQ